MKQLLGAVLVECLTGEPPFRSSDVGELLRMHAVTPPPELRRYGVPGCLAAIVERLLAKDPDDRYLDGERLLRDLHLVADDLGLPIRRVASPAGGGRAALAGREYELAVLADQWTVALGGSGGVCVVRGSGGSGKSRLGAEVAARAEQQGGLVLRGKVDPDDPLPLAPFRAAVDEMLRDADAQPAGKERADFHELVRRCAAGSAPLLTGLTPRLAELLGPESGRYELDQPDLFILAVARFLTELARAGGPVLMVLDDVQWLDPAGCQLLAHLSAELAGAPLMVLATARNDEASIEATDRLTASCGTAVTLDLTLGPLSDEGVEQIVSTLVPGRGAGGALSRIVAERSQGNPFMVQEYVRAIVDAGLLRPSWGAWMLDERGLDALDLPYDVIGLVLARMRDLNPATRRVLVTAATLGARFRPDHVAQVHAVELGAVLDALVEAAGRQLVLTRDGGEYAFVHDRIREASLDGLSPDQERTLHLRIARALDGIASAGDGGQNYAVASHYVRAGHLAPTVDSYLACLAAGRLALDDHAPALALTYLEHAATLGQPIEPELLRLTGTAMKQEGRFHEARHQLEAAVDAEPDPMLRAHTLHLLADVHRSTWNGTEARAAIDRGLRELGAPVPRSRLMLVLGTAAMFLAACLMQWTGIGIGSARADQRRRCSLIAGFHEVGSYVTVQNFEMVHALAHNLRMLYWINRLGHGAQYAQSQAMFGLLCANAGLRGTARRAFARADADPAGEDPAVRAMLAHYRGAATYFGALDDGQLWARELEEHGRSMDLATFGDGVGSLQLEACAQGRTQEALLWLTTARRRQALRPGEITSLIAVEPIAMAAAGRHAEAAAALERMRAATAGHDVREIHVFRLGCTVRVLVEQDERGRGFDDAVDEFEALGVGPAMMIRPQRLIFWGIAMGRLAQCRASDPIDRPIRLAQARKAVRQLRRTGGNKAQSAREIVARSDLLVLEGRPEAALAALAGLAPAYRPDAPMIAYEAARVRARATLALGGTQAARRHAATARLIALEQGWPHRAAWLTDEFGLEHAGATSSPPDSLHQATTTAGGVERQRLQALQQVSVAAARILDPGVLARIALDETIRILVADRAFLFLTDLPVGADGGTPRLVPYLGRDASGVDVSEFTGYSATVTERALAKRRPVVVTGTEQGAAIGAQSAVLHGLRSILAAPLQVEGRVLGVVYLDSQVAKGIFSAADAEILTAITTHIATSMETARAAQLEITARTAQRERDLAERLRGALEHMSGTLEPTAVLARLLGSATQVVGAQAAWLLHIRPEGAVELAGADADTLAWRPLAGDLGSPGADLIRLAETERPIRAGDLAVPPGLAELIGSDWIALPLRSRLEHLGVLLLTGDGVAEEVEVAVTMASQGMTAHENATHYTRVQSLAVTDELTGVRNRRRFFEEAEPALSAAAEQALPVAAVMVDIDHFKGINDTHGHQAGDDVIRTVASRLAAELGPRDLLARYGGEEFALLLTDPATLDTLPERLRHAVANVTVASRAGRLPVTVSVGIARATGDADLSALLARADSALYQAKRQGRNRVATA